MPATVAALVVSGIAPLPDHALTLLRPSPLPSPSSAIDSAVAIAAPASTPGQEMAERGAVSFSTMSVSMLAPPDRWWSGNADSSNIVPLAMLAAGSSATGDLLALLAGLGRPDSDG